VWAQPAAANVSTAYGVNVAHSGLLANDTLAPPLVKHWSRNLGGNVSYPVVAGGLVYVTVENTVSYGTTIHALSAATGRTVWSRPFGGHYYFSAAAYAAGRLFVVNFDGVMIALEAKTGRTLWATQLPGQYAFTSPPTASNGVV
jgi:outer membrane protein assembly factor BamB